MNPALYLLLFLPLLLVLLQRRQTERVVRLHQIRIKRGRGNRKMTELIKRYIGCDCLIYTMNGSNLSGVITEMADGWISVDNGTGIEAVNLDYIVRIRNYPTNKQGKRKSFVTD